MPDLEYICPSSEKRFNDGFIEVLKIDEETYTVINVAANVNKNIKLNNINLIPLGNSLNNIRELDRDLRDTYDSSNWLQKNLAMIVQMAGLMMIIGAMVLIVVLMQDNFNAINGASSSLKDAVNTIGGVVQDLNECRVVGA